MRTLYQMDVVCTFGHGTPYAIQSKPWTHYFFTKKRMGEMRQWHEESHANEHNTKVDFIITKTKIPNDDKMALCWDEREQKLMNPYTPLYSTKGFYIGDLCYVLDNDAKDLYGKVLWDLVGWKYGTTNTDTEKGMWSCTNARTDFGDGCYKGTDKHTYWVDSGTIGLIPLECLEMYECTNPRRDLGRVIHFTDDKTHVAKLTVKGATFTVKIDEEVIKIRT